MAALQFVEINLPFLSVFQRSIGCAGFRKPEGSCSANFSRSDSTVHDPSLPVDAEEQGVPLCGYAHHDASYAFPARQVSMSADFATPVSVSTTDFALLLGFSIHPFSYNRSSVSQSNPFQAR